MMGCKRPFPELMWLLFQLVSFDISLFPKLSTYHGLGIARKPGMTRDGNILSVTLITCLLTSSVDLFKTNAGVIRDLLTGVAKFCPKAFVCIITNPVNSTLPIAVEVLKKHGVFDPTKVFGVTTLDVVRASTFTAQALNLQDPRALKIPVVGGHSGATILPLISQSKPAVTLTKEQLDAVTHRKHLLSFMLLDTKYSGAGVQFGGDEIVKAKAGAGSATTCMAYAGFR
jgi:malate dehydrogenase